MTLSDKDRLKKITELIALPMLFKAKGVKLRLRNMYTYVLGGTETVGLYIIDEDAKAWAQSAPNFIKQPEKIEAMTKCSEFCVFIPDRLADDGPEGEDASWGIGDIADNDRIACRVGYLVWRALKANRKDYFPDMKPLH